MYADRKAEMVIRLYIYRPHWKAMFPIVEVGMYGDYHTIVWLCVYVIIGRRLDLLHTSIPQDKKNSIAA